MHFQDIMSVERVRDFVRRVVETYRTVAFVRDRDGAVIPACFQSNPLPLDRRVLTHYRRITSGDAVSLVLGGMSQAEILDLAKILVLADVLARVKLGEYFTGDLDPATRFSKDGVAPERVAELVKQHTSPHVPPDIWKSGTLDELSRWLIRWLTFSLIEAELQQNLGVVG